MMAVDHAHSSITQANAVRYVANNGQPVFSLPDELLRYIVESLPKCYSHYGEFRCRNFPAYELSRTCRRWRNITLSTPIAWRAIPYFNTYWREECSQRAANSPLERVFACRDFGQHTVELVAPFIPRIS